jgi:probable HAF family extracellular repeat protein
MHLPTPRRLAIAILALATTSAAQAASYHLVDLGRRFFALQINKQGDIAAFRMSHGEGRATVWRAGRWKRLPTEHESFARAINARGDVAGDMEDADGFTHPTLWPRNGEPLMLPLPEGGWVDHTNAISNDQTVVGDFWAPFPYNHCFRWTAAEGAVDLGLMKQGRYCSALAINRAGVIVGWATVRDDGNTHAFRYESGRFHDLGMLPGHTSSIASAINDQGHIVGTSGSGAPDAFLWSGGTLKSIGDSPDFLSTGARAISNRGEIVGWGEAWADRERHAVRFANGQVIALDTEVDDLADWHLDEATSVNEDGVIVGSGRRSDGFYHSFELVPLGER